MGPNETQKLLHSKGKHKQNEKTAYRTGENICKRCDQQGINFQNIQIAHIAQYQKNKQCNQKRAEDLNRHFTKGDIHMVNRHIKDAQHG